MNLKQVEDNLNKKTKKKILVTTYKNKNLIYY